MRRAILLLLAIIGVTIGAFWAVQTWRAERVNARTAEFKDNVDNLFYALQQYKERVGSYPVGDNAQVVQALLGKNPKNLIILVGKKKDLDSRGQFVDPWGTPLRIYFSGEGVLIRSAGPNKRFDDSSTVQNPDDIYYSN